MRMANISQAFRFEIMLIHAGARARTHTHYNKTAEAKAQKFRSTIVFSLQSFNCNQFTFNLFVCAGH